ncbi:MAG: ribosome-associated translation inhibitor RaiA [Clostridia bacterium]|nr:ribosome-associated translation inhibitor RaiA [Clostridia bacterium]
MKVNYTAKKITLRETSKQHIEKKLSKLERFFSDDATAQVMFRLDSNRVIAELTVRDSGVVFRAEDAQTDLMDAFDNAYDNIIRRIRKQKTKLERRLRPAAFEVELFNEPVAEPAGEFNVVKTKQFNLKPLSVQEAILQMELVGHKFYMFKNEQNGQINVVYARNDGAYGLIEAE